MGWRSEADQIQQAAIRLERDQEIDITAFRRGPADDRAEHSHARCAVARRQLENLRALLLQRLLERPSSSLFPPL